MRYTGTFQHFNSKQTQSTNLASAPRTQIPAGFEAVMQRVLAEAKTLMYEQPFKSRAPYRISYIGIMENKMETTIVYWGYIGIMENRMETTISKHRRVFE